jgi:hypothetical protein
VHVLAAMPVKAPHAELIWLAQVFLLHAGGDAAVATEETKTPAPSATAANVTTALRVIVEPPYGRSNPKIDFGALPPRGHLSTRLSRGFGVHPQLAPSHCSPRSMTPFPQTVGPRLRPLAGKAPTQAGRRRQHEPGPGPRCVRARPRSRSLSRPAPRRAPCCGPRVVPAACAVWWAPCPPPAARVRVARLRASRPLVPPARPVTPPQHVRV